MGLQVPDAFIADGRVAVSARFGTSLVDVTQFELKPVER